MSQIPINVEASCAAHPLLKAGSALPRIGQVRVSQQRLFSLGSLWLQDNKKAQFRTWKQTRDAWGFLNMRYAAYLTFSAQQIITDAETELLTDLSEVVGVALGVAAMNAQFNVNLNRFRKFATPGASTKRLDFEYYSGNQRFFHETKGTTYDTRVQGLCDAIDAQKSQTQTYVSNQSGQVAISGCTGSIAQYRHVDRTHFISQITLIDPPPPDQEGARRPSESDELACVLRYYQNFYAATHSLPREGRLIGLADWLAQVASGLEGGGTAPTSAPPNLRVTARVGEPDVPYSLYRGTFFDARLTRRSLLTFRTFAEASRRMESPVNFVGVSDDVTSLIRECRWTDLLAYSNPDASAVPRSNTEILESGIMTKKVEAEETNAGSEKAFRDLQKVVKRL